MIITVSASVSFANEIGQVRDVLVQNDHLVNIPMSVEQILSQKLKMEEFENKRNDGESVNRKRRLNVFKTYFEFIKHSNVLLVLNYTKNGVENYIGGNTLIEMGFAFVLDKPIYLLNPVPLISYQDEIQAMNPIILDNNLDFLINPTN